MNFLDKIKGNDIDSLQRKSESAFDIFRKTIEKLTKVNDKITESEAKKLEKQRLLEEEIKALSNRRAQNTVLVRKIREFIS